ncbi:hypothetical protein ACQKM9_03845, partial [Viridibacillus sp. NPDC093762]|uniref:hypothetical protein n=1 Tax=Viridibacillus sp. NPDC093762 TaxID=3390720 RepID=UPI003D080A61
MAIKYFLTKRIPPYKIYKNDNQKPTMNAMSAVQDHSNRIQGVMGLAGKQMAAVSAAQDNWKHAQGVMGLAGKQMAAVNVAQDNWKHA